MIGLPLWQESNPPLAKHVEATERLALGKLIPRFTGKSWATGETAVPAQALGFLAEQVIKFTVIGPAPYERITPLRDPGPVGVQ